jgi:plastocyanin
MKNILKVSIPLLMICSLVACSSDSTTETTSVQKSPAIAPTVAPAAAPAKSTASTPAGFNPVTGSGTEVTIINGDPGGNTGDYIFKPDTLSFTKGESVDIVLVAETEVHNFKIDELDIDIDIEKGQTSSFNYVFDKPGVYKFICVFHEANGMVGAITVNE